MDAFLGLPYRNYDSLSYAFSKRSGDEKEKWWKDKEDTVAMRPTPALPLERFTGEYTNDVYGTLRIADEGGTLIMHFEHHAMTGTLQALGGTRFFCTYSDPIMGMKVIPFTLDGGKVASLTLHVDDFVEFTPYEFLKK
jgi:hypothetical protein